MDSLRISSTGFGLNYFPHSYAAASGLFEAHGLSVEIKPCNVWTDVLADLAAGTSDLVLGGLWVPAMFGGMDRDLVVVGQINARFPMAIVTREPVADFELSWLVDRVVVVPGAGGTAPYEFTAGLLREAGLRPGDVRFVRDLSTDLFVELYRGGLGDAIVADMTTAVTLQQGGHGTISFRHAEAGGPMPNSVYYTERSRLDAVRPRAIAFMRAIQEAMTKVTASTVAELEPHLAAQWPQIDPGVRTETIGILLANGTWDSATVDRGSCDRWTSILRDAGLVAHPVPFETLVDTTITADSLT